MTDLTGYANIDEESIIDEVNNYIESLRNYDRYEKPIYEEQSCCCCYLSDLSLCVIL